jgi:hypothetical protein
MLATMGRFMLKRLTKEDLPWHIKDWAGNICFLGQRFKDFDDAEEFLSIKLDDTYETDRQEYYLEEFKHAKEKIAVPVL